MFSHLHSQRVNLQLLQESCLAELDVQLQNIDGPKVLVFEESLIALVDLVASRSFLTERKVGVTKFNAEKKTDLNVLRQYKDIIYLIRPTLPVMDAIIAQLKELSGDRAHQQLQRRFHILCLPRRSVMCEKHLEREGQLERFTSIAELPWNFLPLDKDLISMELPRAFRDMSVDGDPTALYQAALGLVQLQRLYGRIPKIYGKGAHSDLVWEWTKRVNMESPGSEGSVNGGGGGGGDDRSPIDQLILLDRSIDVMSALVTQLTYAGLIDEFHGLPQNRFTLPPELRATASPTDSPGPGPSMAPAIERHILNSNDPLYVELRDKNFNEVGRVLSRHANELKNSGDIKQATSISVMKTIAENLIPRKALVASIDMHTSIAVLVRKQLDAYAFTDDLAAEQEFMVCADIDRPSAYIEDLMARQRDMRRVLRLMCIQCAAGTGLKEKVLNYYKRELVQVYGLQSLLAVSNLERAGLLHTQTESRSYSVLRKTLQLTVENAIEVEPRDISYVHSFYAPLMARIVEQTLKPLGWQSLKSQINQLPGPTFDDRQAGGSSSGNGASRINMGAVVSEGASLLNMPRLVMVFFVGGCTYAEIAALRFLAQQEDNNVEFVIATTKVITKHTFLDALLE